MPRRKRERRVKGSGSWYYDEPRDLWRWTVPVGHANGKSTKRAFWGRTKAECEAKCRAYIAANPNGPPRVEQAQRLNDLLKTWIETIIQPRRKARTLETYLRVIRLHIAPAIGQYPLHRLSAPLAQQWVNDLQNTTAGRRAIQQAVAICRACVNVAISWGLMTSNPFAHLDVPKTTGEMVKRQKVLTRTQADALRTHVRGQRLELVYVFCLELGLRIGEALALRWRDVDLETDTLTIRTTLDQKRRDDGGGKTYNALRTLPLEGEHLALLKAHRTRLQQEAHQQGWSPDGYVVCTGKGTAYLYRNVNRHYKAALVAAGIPASYTLHDLRHTCATRWLEDGVPLQVVKDMLGHGHISVTSDRYGHTSVAGMRDALARTRRSG